MTNKKRNKSRSDRNRSRTPKPKWYENSTGQSNDVSKAKYNIRSSSVPPIVSNNEQQSDDVQKTKVLSGINRWVLSKMCQEEKKRDNTVPSLYRTALMQAAHESFLCLLVTRTRLVEEKDTTADA